MKRFWGAMLGVLGLALVGCGGGSSSRYGGSPASPPSYGGYGGGAAGTTSVASEPSPVSETSSSGDSDEARFAQNDQPAAPPPPPPKPQREIDRGATDKPPGDATKKDIDRDGIKSAPVATDAPHDQQYLIYTARITMAVYQVGPGLDLVERIGLDLGGYLSQKTDHEVTIRVPRAHFDEALKKVEASGDVVHREISAQDVTDEFVDLESRLRNARAMRDRLQQLLAKAAVKEALEIEKELGRITGDIEVMEGKLKLLRDRIGYSTITVSFQARGAGAVRDMPLRLPFPWLSNLGLSRLLSLQ
jgi:hypothetical protein